MTEELVILVIDLGSSSIRAGLYHYDSTGIHLIPQSIKQIKKKSLTNSGYGDALEIFRDVNDIVEQSLRSIRELGIKKIDGVSMASFAMNFLGVDGDNHPVTRVYSYASEFLEPIEVIDGDILREHTRQTGTFLHHPSFAPQHLRSHPSKENLKWQTLSCFIFGNWTGLRSNFPVSLSEASWMGLLNLHSNRWDEAAMAYSNVTVSSLPPIYACRTHGVPFSSDWIQHTCWFELAHAKVIPGIADGLAANISSRCYYPSLLTNSSNTFRLHVAVTIGTSAAVRVILPYDLDLIRKLTSSDSGLWVYRVNDSLVIAGGSLTDGGSLADWFATLVGKDRLQNITDELEEMYRQGSLKTSIPTVLPFWSGERSTGWNSDARGAIVGLSHHTTPPLLLYSLLEGVMMRIEVILSKLLSAISTFSTTPLQPRIVISGSSLEKNWVWRQILADILNKEIILPKEDSHSSERTLFGVSEYLADELTDGRSDLKQEWQNHEIESIHVPSNDYRDFFDQRNYEMKKLYESLGGGLRIQG